MTVAAMQVADMKLDASINDPRSSSGSPLIGFGDRFRALRAARSAPFAPAAAFRALCRRGAPQEQQAFDVVDEVCQSDFHRRPRNPDGADEQVHPVLLPRKNMFDLGSDFRFDVVGPRDRLRHGAALGLFAVDMADEAVLLHELFVGFRAIGRVRPHAARCVGLVEKPFA